MRLYSHANSLHQPFFQAQRPTSGKLAAACLVAITDDAWDYVDAVYRVLCDCMNCTHHAGQWWCAMHGTCMLDKVAQLDVPAAHGYLTPPLWNAAKHSYPLSSVCRANDIAAPASRC